MLSAGTRIGPYHVERWIREGSCGQSYGAESSSGEDKGNFRFIKLLHRELSEKDGLSDFFNQECQALEQLEGRGIWSMVGNGVMKWKHWISFSWFEGELITIQPDSPEGESVEHRLRTLDDWMAFAPNEIGPEALRSIMIDIHCGLDRAHRMGFIHGNLKPSNVLVERKENGDFVGWVSEFGLKKLYGFIPVGESVSLANSFSTQSLQLQESARESMRFRPVDAQSKDSPEESWDLFSLGVLAKFVLEKSPLSQDQWKDWHEWIEESTHQGFATIPQSMKSLPGVEDLTQYGVQSDELNPQETLQEDELIKKREIEWNRDQLVSSLKFKRNMTLLVGCLCLISFVLTKAYLFFYPSPWVEYSMEGVSDHYQLGFGLLSGKAWGILPPAYDDEEDGGQDIAGEWSRENGLFKLKFRKFKKLDEEDGGKKLWQFIGKGATSPEDYYVWEDHMRYDQGSDSLVFVKRLHDGEQYLAGRSGEEVPRLFPDVRIRRSGGKIKPCELTFERVGKEGPSWSFFMGVGFLIAGSMYQRNLVRLPPL
jgi:serine/threonine protein kinase